MDVQPQNCITKSLPRILINDRPTFLRNGPPGSSSLNDETGRIRRALPQFIAVGVKNILLFVYGMTLGFPTIVIPAIQGGEGREPSDIVLNREQISWFSSINLICVPLGCVFSGAFSQPIGKRRAMQIVNLPIIVSWLLFHFSTSISYLYAGLCLSGLSGGLMEAPVLTYVAEVTEPQYRGPLAASGSACVIMGVFIQFILGSILDWRTIAAVSTVFPVVSIIALFFVPESPTWLIRQNRFTDAVKALQWLRGWVPEYKVENEFNDLYNQLIIKPEEELKHEQKKSKILRKILLFKKRSFLRPFALVLLTFFIGHFSGKTTLQTYAVQIFHSLKAPIDKYHATILLGMAELIGTVLCVFLIHFTGKRPLVFVSTVGCGLCFGGVATYAYFLNVVPGFAVSNIVNNASLLVPKDSIISLNNLSEIFDKEERAIWQQQNNLSSFFDDEIHTTIIPETLLNLNSTIAYEVVSKEDDGILLANNLTDEYISHETVATPFEDSFFNATDFDYDLNVENTTDEVLIEAAPEISLKKDQDEDLAENILVPVPKQKKNKYLWLPLVLLLGSAFFAHMGVRLIPWLLIGEVFPASIRSTASGLSGGFGYIFGFLANKLFLQMLATLTMPGTFWFYSSIALLGAFILYFVLPETEGKTLSEIEEHFAGTDLMMEKPAKVEDFDSGIEMRMDLTSLAIPGDAPNGTLSTRNGELQTSHTIEKEAGVVNQAFKADEEQVSNVTHL